MKIEQVALVFDLPNDWKIKIIRAAPLGPWAYLLCIARGNADIYWGEGGATAFIGGKLIDTYSSIDEAIAATERVISGDK